MNALVLSVDVGTSSLRTALFDRHGRRVDATTAQRAYRLRTDGTGRAELAPRVLLTAARAALDETFARRAAIERVRDLPVRAVGMSCFWHSLMGADADGQPLTPIFTWADSRCLAAAQRLREQLDAREIHARTGCMLHTSFWPAKLRWFAAHDRRGFARVGTWLSPAEWLYWRLTGIRQCAHGMATGTGLYDPRAKAWATEMLAASGIDSGCLQTLDDTGRVPPRPVRGLPAPLRDALWFPAIGDGAASNLGSGADVPGAVAINLGSSAAVRVMRRGVPSRVPHGLFAYRVDQARYLLGGAVSNAGNLRAWCLEHLALGQSPAALERALARRHAPTHGLTVLPFWNAERAPTWRDDLRGAIVGLTQSTSAVDMLQAIEEATFHRLAQILERIPSQRGARVMVSGGAARSPAHVKRLANVLGRDVHAVRDPEASLRGAALFAFGGLGASAAGPPPTRRVACDTALARLHRAARRRQMELETRLFGAHEW